MHAAGHKGTNADLATRKIVFIFACVREKDFSFGRSGHLEAPAMRMRVRRMTPYHPWRKRQMRDGDVRTDSRPFAHVPGRNIIFRGFDPEVEAQILGLLLAPVDARCAGALIIPMTTSLVQALKL